MSEKNGGLLERVAATICEAACGLYPQCKSREAAQALFDAGLLVSPAIPDSVRGEIAYQLQSRNQFIDMPTMRAIVDGAISGALSAARSS